MMAKYHAALTLEEALADADLRPIVLKHIPRAKGMIMRRIKRVPLEQLLQRVKDPARKEKLSLLIEDLKQNGA